MPGKCSAWPKPAERLCLLAAFDRHATPAAWEFHLDASHRFLADFSPDQAGTPTSHTAQALRAPSGAEPGCSICLGDLPAHPIRFQPVIPENLLYWRVRREQDFPCAYQAARDGPRHLVPYGS